MITVEVAINSLGIHQTFVFLKEGNKVTPQSPGTFVDQANGQIVLGFGIKIDRNELRSFENMDGP